jgi:hypothetical protein
MDSLSGVALDAASLRAWTPVHVATHGAEPRVQWALIDGPFDDPFFEQTAHRTMQHPFNEVFARQTSLDVLGPLRATAPGLAPAGFVFHMSRCGSTLIAQMLSRMSDTIVLSEAQPLDALLRLRGRVPGLDDETLAEYTRAMLSALAQPRAGERRLFVKFHAWHVLELPFIAWAFPGVPWAFVFREPRAVLASQARNAGPEMFAGNLDPAHLGLDAAGAHALPPDEYCARLIAAFCDAALRHAETGRACFVGYGGLPETVFSQLLPFFGIEPSADDVQRMRDVAGLDTKRSVHMAEPRDARTTSSTAGAQPSNADRALGALAARWLDEPYAALCARAARDGAACGRA